MQLFLPQNLDFQVTPADLDRARALATMYAPPRNAPLYPSGLNARGVRGLGDSLQLVCPPMGDCGNQTETPDSLCCQGMADATCATGFAFYGGGCIPPYVAGVSASQPQVVTSYTPSCPPGWVGTYPACSAPASLPTTQALPITAPANVANPLPATIATATTPPNTPIIPMNTGISNTGGTLASQNSGSTSSTSTSSTSTTTASWFTDPTQEVISGIPNWGLVAGAGVGLLALMSMGGKKR
jgi:hypothetical protein